ncbi:MAG: zinc ribbon domain-containing protein [Dehalococcoidia bacterium]|nr:zinc ribbon domain-containing protein [Dehalococcoidia bacterium]
MHNLTIGISILSILISTVMASIIPIIIGVIVYRDAKQRNMNAVLWTLIAVLAPSFIGLIIYLLIRGNYSNLLCPSCESQVTEQYVVCPKCGTRLKASCKKCGTPIKADWSVCPNCSALLADNSCDCFHPIVRKGKSVNRILIAVFILIPILLLVPLGMYFFSMPRSQELWSSSSIGSQNISYYADNYPAVYAWINSCADSSKIHVLRYREENSEYYLFYSQLTHIAIVDVTLNGSSAKFNFREYLIAPAEPQLSNARITNKSFNKISVFIDGDEVDCELTEASFTWINPPPITLSIN